MTTKTKPDPVLPPLPEWMCDFQIPADDQDDSDFNWLDWRMKEYARAALAAQPAVGAESDREQLMRAIVAAGQSAGIIRSDLETVSVSECLHILECLSKPAASGEPAVLRNPYTGELRNIRDVESDPAGTLIVKPGEPLKAAPSAQRAEPAAGLPPTHQCKMCGAYWRQCDDKSWNLRSAKAGPCCDSAPMGEQIVPLYRTEQPAEEARGVDAHTHAKIVANCLMAAKQILGDHWNGACDDALTHADTLVALLAVPAAGKGRYSDIVSDGGMDPRNAADIATAKALAAAGAHGQKTIIDNALYCLRNGDTESVENYLLELRGESPTCGDCGGDTIVGEHGDDCNAAEAEARFADEARAKVRELEQDAARYQHVRAHGMPKLCPAGYYYADGVFYETAEAAIDAARKEKGHD